MSDEVNDQGTGFLKRWSRVKSGTEEHEEDPVDVDPISELQVNDEALPEELVTEPQKILTDEDMPPIDSLHEGSDFSGFLSEGVSAALKKAAMKKLFAQPAFNIRDGLNDYDEDYTSFAPLGDTVTVEMTYRKDIDDKREAAKKALLEEQSQATAIAESEVALREDNATHDEALSASPDEHTQALDASEENPELTQQQNNPDEPSYEHE